MRTQSFFGAATAPEAQAAVEMAAATFEGLGHRVEEASAQAEEAAVRTCLETVWSIGARVAARKAATVPVMYSPGASLPNRNALDTWSPLNHNTMPKLPTSEPRILVRHSQEPTSAPPGRPKAWPLKVCGGACA